MRDVFLCCRTTFIQNLLGPYAQQPDLAVNGVTGPEALKTFENAPEKMATIVEVQDNNSLTNFHYSVQDTPGAIVLRLRQPRGDCVAHDAVSMHWCSCGSAHVYHARLEGTAACLLQMITVFSRAVLEEQMSFKCQVPNQTARKWC